MAELWKSILAQYGQPVTLRREGGGTAVRAFFQPVEEKSPGNQPTPLGTAPVGKWLYLGPAEEALEDVPELSWAGRFFRVLRCRAYCIGGETAYWWAVAEELDEVSP